MTMKVGFIGLGIMGKPMSKTSLKRQVTRWWLLTVTRNPLRK